ncbi:DUF2490 domain-containing protein [Altererythrobacter lauratis]|uniref:DUF2490 domain-containing protein n=1 Tax=Alteraurantiacibacter lauratis TaxID=2054627 RepID=A0ABV7EDZ6_9SPHN
MTRLQWGEITRIVLTTALARLAAFLALLAPVPALATQDDGQLWLYLVGVVPLEDGVVSTLEFSPRRRENADQVLVRGSVDFRVAPGLDVGGGTAWVENAGGHEFRLHQQLQWATGPLQLRSRVEQRFFAGADRAQLRLRQRVQVTVPVAERLRGILNGELLYIAVPENRAQSARVDSWRLNAMASYRLSPRAELAAGYLAIYVPRPGPGDRLSHVPQIRLTLR